MRASRRSMEVSGTGIFPTPPDLPLSSTPFHRLFVASLPPRTGRERTITITITDHFNHLAPNSEKDMYPAAVAVAV